MSLPLQAETPPPPLTPAALSLFAAAVSHLRAFARRFLLVTLILIGAFSGVLAVLFHRYVELARHYMIGRALEQHGVARVLFVVVTPTIIFTILAWTIRRFAPRAVGANLARVRMAYNENPSLLGPRAVGATFLATPLSLGAGAPLGPEGPITVITAGFSAAIARALKLPQKIVRGMIPIGVAAGIAAIFNTPITGVVFALEEILGTAERGILGGVLVGSVAAAVVERMLLGGRAVLSAPVSTWHDARELIGFAIVGVIAGLTSGYAIAIAHKLKRRWAAVMPSMVLRAALSGLLIGAAGLLVPEILGVGYDSVSFWLHGGSGAYQTGFAFLVKIVAFVIAISGGIIGGTFAPSLFIGTALGAAIGHGAQDLFPHAGIDPNAYAVLGMGSFFAGLLRSPIAAVLIVVELTKDYDLVIPLMLGVSLSVAISRRISPMSIVEQQMVDEGWVEEHAAGDPLSNVHVVEAMAANPMTVRVEAMLLDATRSVAGTHHHFYPAVDAEGRFEGILTREAIDEAAREGRLEQLVREVLEQPKLVAVATDLVLDVVRQMQLRGVDRCPILDSEASRRVVGFLSPSDILRARISHSGRRVDEGTFEFFE